MNTQKTMCRAGRRRTSIDGYDCYEHVANRTLGELRYKNLAGLVDFDKSHNCCTKRAL